MTGEIKKCIHRFCRFSILIGPLLKMHDLDQWTSLNYEVLSAYRNSAELMVESSSDGVKGNVNVFVASSEYKLKIASWCTCVVHP